MDGWSLRWSQQSGIVLQFFFVYFLNFIKCILFTNRNLIKMWPTAFEEKFGEG